MSGTRNGVVLDANDGDGADDRHPARVAGRRPVGLVRAARARRRLDPARAAPGRRVARTGGRVDQEYGIPHADGGVRLGLRPLRAAARRHDHLAPTRRSPRPRPRPASAARITTLVDDSPDLVWMFDSHGLIEYASPSVFGARSGCARTRSSAACGARSRTREDVPVLRAAIADAGPDEPRTGMLEVRLRTRDGSWRWVEGQAHAALPRRHGDRGRDHRPRRHPHARRRGHGPPALRAAQGARRRRAGRHPAWSTRHSRIAVINEQACSLLDLAMRPDELVGQRAGRRSCRACAGCSPSPKPAIAQLREIADARRDRALRALRVRRRAPRSASTTSRSARTGRGRLWTFRDITQFKLAEEEQREFLATMSHEIKTPLSGIAGAAELLCGAGLAERERELAEVISDAAQSLGGLRARRARRLAAPRPAAPRTRPPTTTRGAC